MILAFKLSMPGCGSWDGKWSGEGRLYVIIRHVLKNEHPENIIQKSPYRHGWNDGWAARIEVESVDAKEAAKLRRRSAGFCGYDWMVNNIINYGQTNIPHDDGKAKGGAR
jgi:hypothetical protein